MSTRYRFFREVKKELRARITAVIKSDCRTCKFSTSCKFLADLRVGVKSPDLLFCDYDIRHMLNDTKAKKYYNEWNNAMSNADKAYQDAISDFSDSVRGGRIISDEEITTILQAVTNRELHQ